MEALVRHGSVADEPHVGVPYRLSGRRVIAPNQAGWRPLDHRWHFRRAACGVSSVLVASARVSKGERSLNECCMG
jgi:hypothetical protein